MTTDSISIKLGFTPTVLEGIGAISVMAGKIEYLVEQAIWTLKNENPQGVHPTTDSKTISALIKMMVSVENELQPGDLKNLIHHWTQTALPAFSCRNTIFHGVTLRMRWAPNEINYIKSPLWHGEKRKRETKTFIANDHTLDLLITVFETLLSGILLIIQIATENAGPLQNLLAENTLKELRAAKLIAIEIDDLPATVNHEKY